MSATVFLAICILGCDFLLYFLYQWTYGEKRRGISRRSARPKSSVSQPDARPFLIATRKGAARGTHYLGNTRPRAANEAGDTAQYRAQYNEVRAYRRIAASFAHAKR
jgi:hypothetical protein